MHLEFAGASVHHNRVDRPTVACRQVVGLAGAPPKGSKKDLVSVGPRHHGLRPAGFSGRLGDDRDRATSYAPKIGLQEWGNRQFGH